MTTLFMTLGKGEEKFCKIPLEDKNQRQYIFLKAHNTFHLLSQYNLAQIAVIFKKLLIKKCQDSKYSFDNLRS